MTTTNDDATSSNNGWIGDGSENSSLTSSTAADATKTVLTAKAGKPGTPFNIRSTTPLSFPSPETSVFFIIDVQELQGNVSVGIVSDQEFQSGWKTKGMFYNGNVTNGSASLITGFGKYIKSGDKLGVQVVKSSSYFDVKYYVNDKSLGTAFSIPTSSDLIDGKTFYPCVHVSGSVTLTYDDEAVPPSQPSSTTTPQPLSLCGDWKITSLQSISSSSDVKTSIVELPPSRDIVMTLSSNDETMKNNNNPSRISVKVGNTMSGPIQVSNVVVTESGGGGGAIDAADIQIGPNIMSTMMMPPPELYAVEQALSKVLPKLTKIKTVIAQRQIIMSGGGGDDDDGDGDGDKIELTATSYNKVFEPMTKY